MNVGALLYGLGATVVAAQENLYHVASRCEPHRFS